MELKNINYNILMKNLFVYLIFIFFCNFSYAAKWTGNNLSKKENSNPIAYKWYNLYIEDYNNFKNHFASKVYYYCTEVSIVSGASDLTRAAKCNYNEAVRLAKEYHLFYGDFASELYDWHKNDFESSKSIALALIRCNTKNCRNRTLDELDKIQDKIFSRLFLNLDRIALTTADEGNKSFLISENNKNASKKDYFSNFNDNDIISASSGTGFFVSSDGHIISNYHVVEECDLTKLSYQGKEIGISILAVDKINDLSILKANLKPKKYYPVAFEDASLLEEIIIAGYPLGKEVSETIKTTKGIITALAGYGDNYSEFQTDAALNQGNSGGPIMDQKGNIVGVAVANYGKQAGVESFNFGIKSSTLRTFANSNGLKFLSPNNKEMSNKELSTLIVDGTVYLECHMTVAKIKKMLAETENRKAFFKKYQ